MKEPYTVRQAMLDILEHHNERWPKQTIRTERMMTFLKECTATEIKSLISVCLTMTENVELVFEQELEK